MVTKTKKSLIKGDQSLSLSFKSPSVVVIIEKDTSIRWVNNAFVELTGFSRRDVVGTKAPYPWWPDGDRERITGYLMNGLHGGIALYELVMQKKNGDRFWMETVGIRVENKGQFKFYISSWRDISRRKRLEEERDKSEKLYRQIFNNANDAIFIYDLNGNFLQANPAAANITGYTTNELGKMNMSQLLSPDSRRLTRIRENALVNHNTANQRYNLKIMARNGTAVTVETVTSLLTESDGSPWAFQALIRDMTEHNRQKDNMRYYIAQITKVQEEERKRIARHLHDDMAQSLLSICHDIDRVGKSSRGQADAFAENVRIKIDDVLKTLRTSIHSLRPEILDHLGLIPAAEVLVQDLSKNSEIRAHIFINGEDRRLPHDVELSLYRIIQECLHNIRKYSGASQATVTIVFQGDTVKVNIEDNGRGFTIPATLGDFARSGKLGLIGIDERAKLCNGTFSIKSEKGKGTSILIEVPC